LGSLYVMVATVKHMKWSKW